MDSIQEKYDLTIIMPCYNAINVVEYAVNSVIEQLESNMELLLVENGSTDGTDKLLKKYEKTNVKIISTGVNIGVSGARNLGLDNAQGRYVIFYDCDDYVPKGACRALLKAIVKKKADVISGNISEYEEDKLLFTTDIKYETSMFDRILKFGTVWNKIYDKKFLDDNGIRFEKINYGEDTLFVSEVIYHSRKMDYIDDVIYHHIRYGQNKHTTLTRQYKLSSLKEYVYCDINIYSKKYPYPDEIVMKHLCYSIDYLMSYWQKIALNEKEEGFDEVKKVVKLYNWSNKEVTDLFISYFKVDPFTFLKMSVNDYYCNLSSTIKMLFTEIEELKKQAMSEYEMQEMIVSSFREGKIGIQYIVRYGAAWLYSLPNKYLRRHKK